MYIKFYIKILLLFKELSVAAKKVYNIGPQLVKSGPNVPCINPKYTTTNLSSSDYKVFDEWVFHIFVTNKLVWLSQHTLIICHDTSLLLLPTKLLFCNVNRIIADNVYYSKGNVCVFSTIDASQQSLFSVH